MPQKSFGFIGLALALLLASPLAVGYAQSTPAPSADAPDLPVEEIIKRFSEKEKEFKRARENYSFRQEIKVQELTDSDRVRGEYQITVEVSFDDKGRRTEKIVYAPPSTLDKIVLTKEDERDFREIQPFVLTSDEIGKYNLKYGGKEKIDEISAYVFEVSPKKIEKDQRYFEGKIWVDDKDLQIVKSYGKSVPDIITKNNANVFPRFETYREQIDDYWFPTYTRAVDTLEFPEFKQKIREIIRYGNYKRFQSSVKIRVVGEADEATGKAVDAPPADKNAPALDPKYKTEPKADPKKK